MSLDVNQVQQFAVYVDQIRNGGNQNGYVDGIEVSIFKKKIKTADRTVDVDSILKDYDKNKVTREASYDGATPETVEDAIVEAFKPKSNINKTEASKNQGATITEGLKEADSEFSLWNPSTWFNHNNEEVLTYSEMINKDNVLDVVKDDEAIKKLEESKDEVRTAAGKQIIESLLLAAEERQVDVSDIILLDGNGEYRVGRNVKNADGYEIKFGSSVLSEAAVLPVITALRDRINEAKDTAKGDTNDMSKTLNMLADRIDADTTNGGNANGYIDTKAEVKNFKQAAAHHGYDIGKVLQEIRDNEKDGVENTTELQITVANIFDPTRFADKQAEYDNQAADISKAYEHAVAVEDEDLLQFATSMVNADNVMKILNDTPSLITKINEQYNFFWKFWEEDRSEQYTTPILNALVEAARNNNVNIDDIVMISGDRLIVGSAVHGVSVGEDATNKDNVEAVIKAIQVRINQQTT
ncbi:hypothetical protein IKJ53_05040 [bacterium]|nr:hypothetical protein [bacterium]